MRGATTIKVDSIGELLDVLGGALQEHSRTPVLRQIGMLMQASSRNRYFADLGMRFAKQAAEKK